MARRHPGKTRYEFTTNWLAEQSYKRQAGLVYRHQVTYTPAQLAEQRYYERQHKENEMYRQMELGQ